MSCFEEVVVAGPIMLPVICILDAALNSVADKDAISCFDGEGRNESIKLLVISFLGAEITCREGNDGI